MNVEETELAQDEAIQESWRILLACVTKGEFALKENPKVWKLTPGGIVRVAEYLAGKRPPASRKVPNFDDLLLKPTEGG